MAYGEYLTVGSVHNELADFVQTVAEAAGWVTVENGITISGYTVHVFESPNADFYVVIGTTSGETRAFLCEDYNATTQKFKKPSVHKNANVAAASDDSVGTTEYAFADVHTNFGGFINTYTGTSGKQVLISATSSMLWFSWAGPSNENPTAYFGKFNSLVDDASTNDPVTLCSLYLYGPGTGGSLAGTTRSAMNGGKAAHDWRMDFRPWHTSVLYDFADVTNAATYDIYQQGTKPAFSVGTMVRSAASTNAGTFGGLRGRIPSVVLHKGTNSGTFGDTVTIGDNDYVLVYGKTAISESWWFRKGGGSSVVLGAPYTRTNYDGKLVSGSNPEFTDCPEKPTKVTGQIWPRGDW